MIRNPNSPNPKNRATLAAVFLMTALLLGACTGDMISSAARPTLGESAGGPETPGNMVALLRVADATRNGGNLTTAAMLYRRAHEIAPWHADPLIRLGDTLNALGAHAEAAKAWREAIAAAPDDARSLRGLGDTLIALNQPRLAIRQYRDALKIGEDARVYNGLGLASDMIGDFQGAQMYYRAGLETAPADTKLTNNLGLSLALSGDFKEAIARLEQVANAANATPRHRQNLALAYGLSGDTQRAAEIARIDLDEESVRHNLAYYTVLRAESDPVARANALWGTKPSRR